MTSVLFTGLSGRIYEYKPYLITAEWRAVPGNYAFAYLNGNIWPVVYFGETGNFITRFPSHEKWPLAKLYGATHVLAHITQGGETARQTEEKDLIRAYNPVCNTEYRTMGSGLLHQSFRPGATLLSDHAPPKRRATLLGD